MPKTRTKIRDLTSNDFSKVAHTASESAFSVKVISSPSHRAHKGYDNKFPESFFDVPNDLAHVPTPFIPLALHRGHLVERYEPLHRKGCAASLN